MIHVMQTLTHTTPYHTTPHHTTPHHTTPHHTTPHHTTPHHTTPHHTTPHHTTHKSDTWKILNLWMETQHYNVVYHPVIFHWWFKNYQLKIHHSNNCILTTLNSSVHSPIIHETDTLNSYCWCKRHSYIAMVWLHVLVSLRLVSH